jgi:hypothetical protein
MMQLRITLMLYMHGGLFIFYSRILSPGGFLYQNGVVGEWTVTDRQKQRYLIRAAVVSTLFLRLSLIMLCGLYRFIINAETVNT